LLISENIPANEPGEFWPENAGFPAPAFFFLLIDIGLSAGKPPSVLCFPETNRGKVGLCLQFFRYGIDPR